ncbi:MAG: hypothetical protein ACI4PG_08225 [Candidatus Ventricola sp.]
MADRIRIQIEQMEELSNQLSQLASALSALDGEIRSVGLDRTSGSDVKLHLSCGTLRSTGQRVRGSNVRDCLNGLSRAAADLSRYTHAVAGSIGMSANAFADMERTLANRFSSLLNGNSATFGGICQALGFPGDMSRWTPKMRDEYRHLLTSGALVVDGNMALLKRGTTRYLIGPNGLLAELDEKTGLSGSKQTVKLFSGDSMFKSTVQTGLHVAGAKSKFEPIEQQKLFEDKVRLDTNGNPVTGDDPKDKLGQRVDILSAGVSASEAVSAWYRGGKAEGDNYKLEGEIGIGNAEVSGSIVGGFGTYLPGKDGKLHLNVGGQAEIGASVSALEMKGSAEYELCDAVSLSAGGDVSVMSGELEASAALGIIDGKFAAYASAGAEANLVEANGEVGVDIAGVKGIVGAGVQVGIGASAKAGYKDGVISLDASLSFGVGASVNLELDVSGLVDNVGEAVGSFVDGLGSISAWWR